MALWPQAQPERPGMYPLLKLLHVARRVRARHRARHWARWPSGHLPRRGARGRSSPPPRCSTRATGSMRGSVIPSFFGASQLPGSSPPRPGTSPDCRRPSELDVAAALLLPAPCAARFPLYFVLSRRQRETALRDAVAAGLNHARAAGWRSRTAACFGPARWRRGSIAAIVILMVLKPRGSWRQAGFGACSRSWARGSAHGAPPQPAPRPTRQARWRSLDLAAIWHDPDIETARSAAERRVAPLGLTAQGGMNPGDRRALYYLVRHLRPERVLEIGTLAGASTVHLAMGLADAWRGRSPPDC